MFKEEIYMHQYRRHPALALTFIGAVLVGSLSAGAHTPADNTKVNERDRAKGAPTADQQKENTGDRELTQKIRRALIDDKKLSTYAHNVKIISQDGQVTLKGPVRTEEEKKIVEARAAEVAGVGHVINQISVAPVKGAKK